MPLFRSFILFYLFTGNLSAQERDTVWVLEQYEKGKSYFPKAVDSVEYYYQLGLDRAVELSYHNGEVTILRSRGVVRGLIGKSEAGVADLQKAISIIETQSLPDIELINCYINLGATHDRAGKSGEALSAYIKGEEIARKIDAKAKRSMLLNNIAILYRKSERFNEALDIYNQALAIRKESNDSSGVASVLLNISSCYASMGALEEHLAFAKQSVEIYKSLGDSEGMHFANASYGEALIRMGEYKEGIGVLESVDLSSFRMAERSAVTMGLSQGYHNIGEYKKASGYLSSLDEAFLNSNLNEFKISYFEILYKNRAALGQWSAAYQAQNEFINLQKEVTTAQKLELRQEMEEKYLAVEKDLKIELQETQLSRTKRERFFMVIGLAGLGLISLLLFRLTGIRKKNNAVLAEKNEVISKALGEKEILLREIHHRVKNNLQFISSLLGLQTDYVQDQVALDVLQEGQDRVKSMALIHQNLYQEEDLTGVEMKDYFIKLTRGLFDSYNIRKDQIQLELDIEPLNLDVDTVIPIGLIVNELVSNCLKYAFEKGEKGVIIVGLKEEQDLLVLTVQDNGKGISEAAQEQLGSSFGYKLIHVLCQQMKATLDIQNKDGAIVTLAFQKYEVSNRDAS